jgi:hypothetical protein
VQRSLLSNMTFVCTRTIVCLRRGYTNRVVSSLLLSVVQTYRNMNLHNSEMSTILYYARLTGWGGEGAAMANNEVLEDIATSIADGLNEKKRPILGIRRNVTQ